MSPESWACAVLEIQPQFIPGVESLSKAGRVLRLVLESLNFRLIPWTPRLMGHSLQLCTGRVRAWKLGLDSPSGLFLVDTKAGRGCFLWLGVSHKWDEELFAYQDLVCCLPGQPISYLFIDLLFHLTFIFSLWLLKLCLKTRGCLLITSLWVLKGEAGRGKCDVLWPLCSSERGSQMQEISRNSNF